LSLFDQAKKLFEAGVISIEARNYPQAEMLLYEANRLVPQRYSILQNLALVKFRQNKILDSKLICENLIELDPKQSDGWNSLGFVFYAEGDTTKAIDCFDQAISVDPFFSELHVNKATVLYSLLKLDEAEACFNEALKVNPNGPEALFGKSTINLLRGEFSAGLPLYEARKNMKEPSGERQFSVPLWLGDVDINQKSILVHHEQGLGDTIQFCRYLKLLDKTGAKIFFTSQPSLNHLMRTIEADFVLLNQADTDIRCDFHIPLLSLPLAFKTTLDTIPSFSNYLSADTEITSSWRKRIGIKGIKIGICWQGKSDQHDIGRSFPVKLFEKISKLENIRLISLHKGDGQDQLNQLPANMTIETLGGNFDDGPDAFIDSAAIIKCLDLVITSDTAIAHLAGALGAPVWLALKYGPEWRWLLNRVDSPWYPSMRLFRQSSPGDWSSVFERIEMMIRDQFNLTALL